MESLYSFLMVLFVEKSGGLIGFAAADKDETSAGTIAVTNTVPWRSFGVPVVDVFG